MSSTCNAKCSTSPTQITALATGFRQRRLPVIHIRHRNDNRSSPLHADAAGYPPMPYAERSCFHQKHLAAHLAQSGITQLLVTGAMAGFCVNSTLRSGADLGFDVTMARLASDFARLWSIQPTNPPRQPIAKAPPLSRIDATIQRRAGAVEQVAVAPFKANIFRPFQPPQ